MAMVTYEICDCCDFRNPVFRVNEYPQVGQEHLDNPKTYNLCNVCSSSIISRIATSTPDSASRMRLNQILQIIAWCTNYIVKEIHNARK